MVAFLLENDKKFSLLSIDGKVSAGCFVLFFVLFCSVLFCFVLFVLSVYLFLVTLHHVENTNGSRSRYRYLFSWSYFVSLIFTFHVIFICIVLFFLDKNAIYFVSTSKKGPEMYEFVCTNPRVKKQ